MTEEAKKLLLKLAEKDRMNFQEMVGIVPNRNRAQKLRNRLLKKKLIRQETENWKRGQEKSYSLTEEGLLQCNELEISSINENVKRLQKISSGLMTPNNLHRFRQETQVPFPKYFPINTDPNAPARIDVMSEEQLKEYLEENKELFERREKLLGELHCVFFDLTKILITVGTGITMAEDDLSNIQIRFRNKEPVWMMSPSTS